MLFSSSGRIQDVPIQLKRRRSGSQTVPADKLRPHGRKLTRGIKRLKRGLHFHIDARISLYSDVNLETVLGS